MRIRIVDCFLFVFQFLVIFLFLLKLPLIVGITSRNLALLIAIITLICRINDLKAILRLLSFKKNCVVLLLFSLCTLISYYNLPNYRFSTTQYLEPWFFFYEYIHIMVFSIYMMLLFKDFDNFLEAYVAIFLVQAIAVFMAVIDPNVRFFLYSTFYVGDERFERGIELGTRIMGIGIYASSGSIICSTICLFLVYAALKGRLSHYLFLILYFIMVSMTIFIGRTGVIVELLVLMYYFLATKISVKKVMFVVMLVCLVPVVAAYFFSFMDVNSAQILLEWAFGFLDIDQVEGTASVVAYKYPDFDEHMIFGTGVLRGTTSYGSYVWSDSGYVKTYCAIGIVGAFLYYLAYKYVFSIPKIQKSSKKVFRYLVLVILISYVIEYKEPYMHRCIFNWAIMTMLMFEAKSIRIKEVR